MQNKFFSVGPSQLYNTYQSHWQQAMEMQLGSISHRSAQFRKIYQHTDEQLRLLLQIPKSHSIFFMPSASEIWERMILNLVEKKSCHFVNGAFSEKFYTYAKALGKQTQSIEVPHGKAFENINHLQIDEDAELICITQNETASGIQIPEIEISDLKKAHSAKLVCVDIVSTAPYAHIDYQYIDSSFFSVQKAFGMPPGLGVWICNDACVEKSKYLEEKKIHIGAHHRLSVFKKNYDRFETPSTPNVVAIYILGKIAEDMNKIGIDSIRQDMNKKAELLYSLGTTSQAFSFSETNRSKLSKTTTVFNTNIESAIIMDEIKKHHTIISSGYNEYKNTQIRIANFPATTYEDMEILVSLLKQF